MKSPPELLLPAGDAERLSTAIQYGADAVYLGREQFSMRAAASYFNTAERLQEAVKTAHAAGKKLYLTCNTLPRQSELENYPHFLEDATEAGVDALIIADLGMLTLTRKYAPDIEIHMSTQTGIVNAETCRTLYDMGVKRAVLARELSLAEIATIRDKIPAEMELEVFVHGAMCVSVSGRCLLSAYLTGRDANRGACAQPCRWQYAVIEQTRPEQYYPIEETQEGTYLFNAKDLCMIDHLDDLIVAGVNSFKVEGRQKSAYYVAVIANAYRIAIDALIAGDAPPKWALDEVKNVSHREYCTGFFYDKNDATERYASSSYVQNYTIIAVVMGYENNRLILQQRNRFFENDMIEIIAPHEIPKSLTVHDLRDSDNNAISTANHAMMTCSIATDEAFPVGSMLRRKTVL